MQHPLVHWLYGDAWRLLSCLLSSVIACITSAETVYRNYKGQNAKTSLSFGLCRGTKYGILRSWICVRCHRDVCNDDIIDRNSTQQGNWNVLKAAIMFLLVKYVVHAFCPAIV
jgi:hypothetical protein